jgi:preprotein translocase SecE subunit
MSMAVVEEQAALEQAPRSPYKQLGIASLLGAVYVLFALVFVFGLLPTLWEEMLGVSRAIAEAREPVINPFLSGTLLLLTMIVAATGLWFLGVILERRHSQHGLRAGVFFAALAIMLILWLVTKLGLLMAGDEANPVGVGVAGLVVLGLSAGVFWLFSQPGFARWLGRVEDAGWFHAIPYKANQGVRVRRGTIVALLTVGLCGIYTLVTSRLLGASYQRIIDWIWEIPFTRESGADSTTFSYVPLVHNVSVVVPILLAAALLWFCWRVVNWPTFADFLIATEAEINKVSWTTRRRLVQDTIVVLVTVFLMTAFLFVVDILWIKVLTHPWVSVLQVDIKSEFQKQQQKTQW